MADRCPGLHMEPARLQQGLPDWEATTQDVDRPKLVLLLQGAAVNKSLPSLARQPDTTISQ